MDKYFRSKESIQGYTILKVLGEGRYGIAYLVRNEKSQRFILKQLKNEMLEKSRSKLFYEEAILKSLDYPAIPKFISKVKDKYREGYILQYMEGIPFEDLLVEENRVFNKPEIYDIGIQLLDILDVLHKKNIVHRDIRLPNVILMENNQLALIDFGLARYVDNEKYKKETDYWFLGDFLIHLYYTTYENNGLDERPWHEELDLNPQERHVLKRLMGIEETYENNEQIRQDLMELQTISEMNVKEGNSVTRKIEIQKIHIKSFRANLYNIDPFRMIGLIDVNIEYDYGIERVTLPFYRSSGTNNGKIKGLWYPIVGIKLHTGGFTEFTDYLNHALTVETRRGFAKKGWLAKSLFFTDEFVPKSRIRGFSNGKHYESLLEIGKTLRQLYERERYYEMYTLDPETLNQIVTSDEIYPGNTHSQRENFDRFIADIIEGAK